MRCQNSISAAMPFQQRCGVRISTDSSIMVRRGLGVLILCNVCVWSACVCVNAYASGLTCLCLCVHRCIHLSQVTMMIMLVQRGLNIIFISVRTTGLMVGWMDGWMDGWGRIVDELIWNWWANWKISTQTERWCLGVLIHVLRNGTDTWNNRTCVEAHT